MINRSSIIQWRAQAPWNTNEQVEQDLISGNCELTTYMLDELLGTKLRALYQRKKGRDLFDLHRALTLAEVNIDLVIRCYKRYMELSYSTPTYNHLSK